MLYLKPALLGILAVITFGPPIQAQKITKLKDVPPQKPGRFNIQSGTTVGNQDDKPPVVGPSYDALGESPERYSIWQNSRNAILQMIDRDDKRALEKMDTYLGEVRLALETEIKYYNKSSFYQETGSPLPHSPLNVANVAETFASFGLDSPQHPTNPLLSDLGSMSFALSVLDTYASELAKGAIEPTAASLDGIKDAYLKQTLNDSKSITKSNYTYALKYFRDRGQPGKAEEVKNAQTEDYIFLATNRNYLFSPKAASPFKTVAIHRQIQTYAFMEKLLNEREYKSSEIDRIMKGAMGEYLKKNKHSIDTSLLDSFTCLNDVRMPLNAEGQPEFNRKILRGKWPCAHLLEEQVTKILRKSAT